MMDRDKIDEQPNSQVGFIQGICIPCYDLLHKLIPETQPLLDGCKVNLARWKAMVEQQKIMKEKVEQKKVEHKENGGTSKPGPHK